MDDDMNKNISIVMACYNNYDFLEKALNSLNHQTFKNLEVVIIDNFSDDKLKGANLAQRYDFPVSVYRMSSNLGYAGGINRGIALAKNDIIVVLNVDLTFARDFLSVIYHKFYGDDSVELASMHVKSSNNSSTESFGVYLTRFIRAKNATNFKKAVLGPHGAAFAFRKSLLEKAGCKHGILYDERYFFLWEDIEFALRCTLKGIKTHVLNEAVCYHHGNGTKSNYFYKQFLSIRNRYFLINTYFRDYLIRYIFVVVFYDFPRLLFFLLFNPYRFKLFHSLQK